MAKLTINTHELLELFNSGKSYVQIGNELGVSANTVMRRLQDIGISSDKYKEFDKEELQDMYVTKGMTTQEIGDIFKVSKTCINRALRKHEIPLRESGHRIRVDADVRSLMSTYAYNATKRGYAFNLSFKKFKELIHSNCHYCGAEPSQHYTNKCYDLTYNGIDRIDNNIGYEDNNVVTCCWKCNNVKGNLSHKEFVEHGIKMYNHYFNKFDNHKED